MSSPAASVRSRLSVPARGLAGAAVQRARLSVVPRRRSRAPKVPFVTLVSLLLLAGVVGLLLFNTSMQQAAFTTTALEDQATTLAARQQALEHEVEEMRDPQYLGSRAQEQGMVPSCAPLFLDLGTGQVKGSGAPCQGTPLPLKAEEPARPGVLDPPARRVYADTTRDSRANASAAGRTRTQP